MLEMTSEVRLVKKNMQPEQSLAKTSPVVLITGGDSGIRLGIAHKFAEEGYGVAMKMEESSISTFLN